MRYYVLMTQTQTTTAAVLDVEAIAARLAARRTERARREHALRARPASWGSFVADCLAREAGSQ